jgi:hypothetical protein
MRDNTIVVLLVLEYSLRRNKQIQQIPGMIQVSKPIIIWQVDFAMYEIQFRFDC